MGGDPPALSFPALGITEEALRPDGPGWPNLGMEDSCPGEPPGPTLALLCEAKEGWGYLQQSPAYLDCSPGAQRGR